MSPGLNATARSRGKRIVLTCLGSLGDLHPYLALALELQARGHAPVLATSALYRDRIEPLGLAFHPVRPQLVAPDDPATLRLLERCLDPKRGPERLLREFLLPAVRASYADLDAACTDADLLVSHPITFAAPLVAQKRGLAWAATMLAPFSLWSNHAPPVVAGMPWFHSIATRGGPRVTAALRKLVDLRTDAWMEPVYALRRELGLPRGRHPVFEGQYSPQLNLALFSRVLSAPQPDWPAHTVITGFPFYDGAGTALAPELRAFLDAGEPPLVFTLGSAAVHIAGDFFTQSAQAASLLGRRAVLLVGRAEQTPATLPAGVIAVDYAPFSLLFPRAAAIVHQGGVGTTGQGLRAGVPTLIVPYSNDQPDNAARIARIGTGRVLARRRYRAARVARELRELLENPAYAARATVIGEQVRAEQGTHVAADQLLGAAAPP